MKNSLTKERRKGAGKKRIFAALFSFLLVCMIFISAAIPAAAAPDETDAYLQQYLFGTKNFYHMREFNHRYQNSSKTVTIASNYSEVSNRTDVSVVFSGSSLGSKYSGHYAAKCGTCIDGEEMCYINPSLYGANIGVVSVWLEIPNDQNEIPVDYVFNPYSVNFYFSNAYEDWFYYAGDCIVGGRQYFVYYKFFYTTTKNDRLAYHNIAMEFYSNFDLRSFYVYTGLEYFNVNVDYENLMGSLHGLMVPGAVYGISCLKSPPSAHLTEVENGYLLGLSASDKVDEIYNEGVSVGKQVGYGNGYDVGFSFGEAWGYQNGEKVGYDNGYKEGYDLGFDDGYSAADPGHLFADLKDNINSSIDNMSNMLSEKVDGANTAIGDDDGNAVFAFFNGTWNGIADFYDVVTSGVSVSGIELSSFIVSLVMILMAFVLLKILIL